MATRASAMQAVKRAIVDVREKACGRSGAGVCQRIGVEHGLSAGLLPCTSAAGMSCKTVVRMTVKAACIQGSSLQHAGWSQAGMLGCSTACRAAAHYACSAHLQSCGTRWVSVLVELCWRGSAEWNISPRASNTPKCVRDDRVCG